MSRPAPTLLVPLFALVVACSSEAPASCPGVAVGRFVFTGSRTDQPLPAGLDPYTDPTCGAGLDPAFPTTIEFAGTLAGEAGHAALCRGGPMLQGTRTGARWDVKTASDGAVLGACGSTCAARSSIAVRGDVGPDPEAPTSFVGAFVEQLTRSDGDCGGCVLPCATRYTLDGAVEAP